MPSLHPHCLLWDDSFWSLRRSFAERRVSSYSISRRLSPITIMIGMLWTRYKQALAKHPLWVKSCTAAMLMSFSDICAQIHERQALSFDRSRRRTVVNDCCKKHQQQSCSAKTIITTDTPQIKQINPFQYNFHRTLHVGLTGLTFSGPISHAWYALLEVAVTRLSFATGSAVLTLATKLVLDALVFSPLAVTGYFCWRSVLEGTNASWKLQYKWWTALRASWSFWPVANVVNFSLVPLPYRVLYNNSLSVVWNAYLSNLNAISLG